MDFSEAHVGTAIGPVKTVCNQLLPVHGIVLSYQMEARQEQKLSTAYKTVRRKFCQSIFRWSANDSVNEETKSPNPPDVGDLVKLLRSLGFKLRQFDKCEHKIEYSMSASNTSLNSAADGLKNAECRVEITCGHSGLRAILESVVGECSCPPVESATQAEFWQISGSAPVAKGSQESIGSIQEAGSSLVPPLPPAVSAVVRDIMVRVLQIIYDPDFGELNTSRHSLPGNSLTNLSHHRSLDTLPLTHSSTKQYGSKTDTVESTEQDNKKLLARTLSNVELSTSCASALSKSGSTGDLIKDHGKMDNMTTSRQSSSPSSNLSASLERMTLTERHGIMTRLEFAKRSISEAMCMLEVQPLSINTACKKARVENTSTPTSEAKKNVSLKKAPGTPGTMKKTHGTPRSVNIVPNTPRSTQKISGTTGHIKKTPGSAGTIGKLSGTPGDMRKKSAIQTHLNTAVPSTSARAEPPVPHISKLSEALSNPRKEASPHPEHKFVSSRIARNPKNLVGTPSRGTIVHTPSDTKTNISTGSSSSSSSVSSTKTRKLINAVRRVSRMSSSGGAADTKPSEGK